MMLFTQCSESPSDHRTFQSKKDPLLNTTLKQKSAFNKKDFSDIIPFDYDVDWEGGTSGYSKELDSKYIEYTIRLRSKNSVSGQRNSASKYKLLAAGTPKETEFYVLKFLKKTTKDQPGIGALGCN